MLAYIVRRLLWTPVILLTVTLVTFYLGLYGPGDPIQVRMGAKANPEAVARVRHELGLDRPLWEQYLGYVQKVVLWGDFGESLQFPGKAVGDLIFKKIWVSAQLGLAAMIISLGIGIPLGLFAALKQGTWLDTFVISLSLLGMSLPAFVTIPVFLYVFSFTLHLMPSYGWGGLFDLRIVMPALVLGIPPIAAFARLMRASTLEVIGQDYVRTARAKGLTERVVINRHIARNALLPIFTVVGLSLATLVEGAFITETFFGIPGIGRMTVDSLFARDYPVIMALTLLVAVAYIMANIIVDIGYHFLDPRIRYA